eukprot:scaffold155037_cov19-Prasinocladus_malaysianus.AAC.1
MASTFVLVRRPCLRSDDYSVPVPDGTCTSTSLSRQGGSRLGLAKRSGPQSGDLSVIGTVRYRIGGLNGVTRTSTGIAYSWEFVTGIEGLSLVDPCKS